MVHHIHDYGYKKLFSNVTIFRQLLETFVDQPWIKDLDFSTAETINHSFVSKDYQETESDLIYKVKLNSSATLTSREQDIFIYLLLEFQSTVDTFISVRILNYITSFYLTLLKSGQHGGTRRTVPLPPVFPIVIYNGDDRWSAPESIADTIGHHQLLGDYGIGFKYLKIAENEYPAEKLLKIQNIVSTLFLAENHYNLEQLQSDLLDLFEKEDRQAISLFLNWFRMLTVDGRINPLDYQSFERIYLDKTEVKQMLATAMSEKDKRLIAEGEARGKIKTALKMKAKGFDAATISECTGLTLDEIEKL